MNSLLIFALAGAASLKALAGEPPPDSTAKEAPAFISVTNWVKAAASLRSASNHVYDVNTSKEWETIEIPNGVEIIPIYRGVSGAPTTFLAWMGPSHKLSVHNFPYDPKAFTLNRSRGTTPAKTLKFRAFPISGHTNFSGLGSIISITRIVDYGLPYTNLITQVQKIDSPQKPNEQYLLAVRYLGGTGVEKDREKAKFWFSAAMTNGSVEASNAFRKFFPRAN
jgi:TPR repeat protein